LGAIFYALLTGKARVGGDSLIDTLDPPCGDPPAGAADAAERPGSSRSGAEFVPEVPWRRARPIATLPRGGSGTTCAVRLRRAGERCVRRCRRAGGEVARRKPTVAPRTRWGCWRRCWAGGKARPSGNGAPRCTAKATAERLTSSSVVPSNNQKQLADQLKRLADDRATQAKSAETARDNLIATITNSSSR